MSKKDGPVNEVHLDLDELAGRISRMGQTGQGMFVIADVAALVCIARAALAVDGHTGCRFCDTSTDAPTYPLNELRTALKAVRK